MIQLTQIDYNTLLPEIFLACSALLLLLYVAYSGSKQKTSNVLKMALISFVVAAYLLLAYDKVGQQVFNNMIIQDNYAVFMKTLILAASGLVVLLSLEIGQPKHLLKPEYGVLLMLSVVGMMIMVSANDLITLYMGLELQSLSLYVMTSIKRDNDKASEAGLKYFMLGALSSGLLLFGSSFIYGFTGTMNFSEIAKLYSNQEPISVGALFGLILVLTGIFFKLSAVPFHMWVPDVYEGAPKPVVAFFATAPKVAAIGLLIRILHQPFGTFVADWSQIIIAVSIASMVVGAFGALRQHNIKRLMAYSSIGHVGFILVGLAAGREGVGAALVYTVIYVAMNIGTFTCIMLMKRHDAHVENIGELSGLSKNNPLLAMIMTILMFSMAGIPPMAGFFGKFFVFKAAVDQGLFTLAIIGVLTSVVGAFYYLRIIKIIYFDAPNEVLDKPKRTEMLFLLIIAGIFNLGFFLMPSGLISVAESAAGSLLF